MAPNRLVFQPNDLFMGFVNTKDGRATSGSAAILAFIKENNITNDIIALGSDCTNTNIGSGVKINCFIEVALKRHLHWFVCMLHANELPLKKIDTEIGWQSNWLTFILWTDWKSYRTN